MYGALGYLLLTTGAYCLYGYLYTPSPKQQQLVSPHRVLATTVMIATKGCDLETIRNLAHRDLFTTVVQVDNFTQHCVPGALTYQYVSEQVKSYHDRYKNGSEEHYTIGQTQYTAQLDGKTFTMAITTEQKSGESIVLIGVTDPYYSYIKDKDIFAEGVAH